MIYLNNGATSYPKPQCVYDAHAEALKNPPSGQYRSTGSFAQKDYLTECRKKLGQIFGVKEWERIFFSSGATDSFNRVWRGLNLPDVPVFITETEHNSVLRPIYNSRRSKIVPIPCDEKGEVPIGILREKVRQTFEELPGKEYTESRESLEAVGRYEKFLGIVIVNHCSNVTGMVQDMAHIGKICEEFHLLFVADVSQSAGCIPIEADVWGMDILIFTGHKSLYGVQGTGGYYIRSRVPCPPSVYGGTGEDGRTLLYRDGNENYEVGTQNIPGIAALLAGAEYVLERGIHEIHAREMELMKELYTGLEAMRGVHVFGSSATNQGPLLSFIIRGMRCGDVAYILEQAYGIRVRTGLHCAPLIHERIGTGEDGTIRVSISDFTGREEIDALLRAVRDIWAAGEEGRGEGWE